MPDTVVYTPEVVRQVSGLLASAGALLVTPAIAASLATFRDGPLPGMTGGFGEPTCHSCHFDRRVNDPRGTLRLEGVPRTYSPGREYPITVIVRRGATSGGGFEMSARFLAAPDTGRQAGRLRSADARTQVVSGKESDVQYIQHTDVGSALSRGEGRWTTLWTAPIDGSGPVAFHVAANAANDDASPLGDFIYTTTATSRGRSR